MLTLQLINQDPEDVIRRLPCTAETTRRQRRCAQ